MASSGFVLKKSENIEFNKLLKDIKLASYRAGLRVRIDTNIYEDYGTEVYTIGYLANTFEEIPNAQQWVMYIYSNDKDHYRFDNIIKIKGLTRIIVIERISDCERMLLDFLSEYFKLNSEDLFLVEEYDWFYTYEDIMEIKRRKFDPDWCYKDPHADK